MGEKQKEFMDNKIQVVKTEHEKVAEINYIYKLKKENKDFNIMNKFKQSIIRRDKYLQERVNKLDIRSDNIVSEYLIQLLVK